MENIVLAVILVAVVCAALVPFVKHFKGQGGCCGGGTYKPKKKRLDHVVGRRVFHVEGMHCINCSNTVMEAVNDITGVSAVVDYKKGIATVSYAKVVEDQVIIDKIQKAGYKACI